MFVLFKILISCFSRSNVSKEHFMGYPYLSVCVSCFWRGLSTCMNGGQRSFWGTQRARPRSYFPTRSFNLHDLELHENKNSANDVLEPRLMLNNDVR
jgi:hypothetical protein